MRILFACDLDNTLIYSYKKKQDGYICVELNKGREQGFMTAYTFGNFADMVGKVVFVPVTTRSVEQYCRIIFPNGYVPEYALVSNGATLVRNGEIAENWDLIDKKNLGFRLNEIYSRYCKDKRFINCRIVDNSYVFVYCSPDTDAEKVTRELADSVPLNVELSGRKIYFFPENLNKGSAVSKLDGILNCDCVVSAGDSLIDVPMLNIADIAVIPFNFSGEPGNHNKIVRAGENDIFSDFVINYIKSGAFSQ